MRRYRRGFGDSGQDMSQSIANFSIPPPVFSPSELQLPPLQITQSANTQLPLILAAVAAIVLLTQKR